MNPDSPPSAYAVWFCGLCDHALSRVVSCPCCAPELACPDCDAHYDQAGEFISIGGAS